jgi:hypothetical protein
MTELTIESMSDCFGECWDEPEYRPHLAALELARREASSPVFRQLMRDGREAAAVARFLGSFPKRSRLIRTTEPDGKIIVIVGAPKGKR